MALRTLPPLPTGPERQRLLAAWSQTRCELATPAGWRRVQLATSDTPLALITACNPGGRLLSPGINAARDRLLEAELAAWGCPARRARGCARDGGWCEEGWAIALEPPLRVLQLLVRYGQLAAFLVHGAGRRLLWADGSQQPLPEPD